MFLHWFFHSFAGWLLRKQLMMITLAITALARLARRGVKTIGRGKVVRIEKAVVDEGKREAGCKKIVLEFAAVNGYMTRDVMSPQELDSLIKGGIQPEDLISELQKRVAQVPGITLGTRHGYEMKFPYKLRTRHTYIVGRSGSGKTNLIRSMLLQDAYYGRGVGVLAPEQELLTDEILPYISENRIDDVVYVNPADPNPIAFNPLHCEPWEDKDEKIEDFVTIFKRAVGDTGFRMDDILDHTLSALIDRPGSTLLDIPRLLSRENPTFRNEVVRTADERVRFFFQEQYPSMDRSAANPVISRINAFTRREAVRKVLCRPGESFNFRRAMDEGKIVLFNLSDGILGEQASQLLGQIIISKIQLAAMSRADIPKAQRRPFHLYLDEFQTFTGVASTSYSKILSRARKYNLGLVLAHQQTGQIPQTLLKEIFGNVTTFISFNVSSEDARRLSQEYTYEAGMEVGHVEPEDFLRLKTGEAIAKIGRTVFPLQTILMPDNPDHRRAQFIINRSRSNYNKGWSVNTKPPEPLLLPPPENEDENDDSDPRRMF